MPDMEGANAVSVKLSDILEHDALFTEYPELKNIKVDFRTVDGQDHVGAMYYPVQKGVKSGYIVMNTNGNLKEGFNGKYHKYLLHEVQHAIQDIEGHDNGDNISNYFPENYPAQKYKEEELARQLAEFGRNVFRGSVKRYGLDLSNPQVKQLVEEASKAVKEKMTQKGYDSSDHKTAAEAALDALNHLAGQPSTHTASILDIYNTAEAYETVHNKNVEIYNNAYKKYRKNLGESEAHFTQENINTPLDKLPINPEMVKYADTTLNDDSKAKGTPSQAFRAKGEGEINPKAYDRWTHLLAGADVDMIDNHRELNGNDDPSVAVYDWATKATKRYLDKYAGTPEDPLNNVLLPNGTRWEDGMDASVFKRLMPKKMGIGMTDVYYPGFYNHEGDELEDFIRHVGDYTYYVYTTHPARLGQYDFVRMVRETLANDAAMAKKAAKARVKSAEGMPIHRQYADGFKWVQLTKPGDFAQESDVMGHSVRGYEPTRPNIMNPREWLSSKGPDDLGAKLRQSLGTKHTTVNHWTKMIEETPEYQEFFKKEMAKHDWIEASGDSGNEYYGHGGWDGIKSGEAKVYSLRDPDGMSHVTIEVQDTAEKGNQRDFVITQIKGKQNRTPSAQYLPYVQDFVESSEWLNILDGWNAGYVKGENGWTTPERVVKAAQLINRHVTEKTLKQYQDAIEDRSDEGQAILYGLQQAESINENRPDRTDAPKVVSKNNAPTNGGLAYNPRLTTQRMKVKSGPVLDAFKRAAFSFGGVGRQLGNMIENAAHFSEVFSHRAGKYERLLARGLTNAAKRTGVSREDMVKTIYARLKSIAEVPLARREAALTGLIREYPEMIDLGRSMSDINALSQVLLRQYLEAYPDPTPEQLDMMSKFHNNAFKYMTNMYAAFQGETGVKYSKNLKDAYVSVTTLAGKKGTLPAKLVAKAQVWKNAMDYITNNNITIPDEENIGSLKDSHINDLFSTWIAPADQFGKAEHARALAQGMTEKEADAHVRTAMEAMLLEVAPTLSKADYEGKANLIVESMLGLGKPGNAFADYYRGMKQDRTILQERTHLPEPIQKLFGKIEDPAAALAITIAKQAELAGRTRLLLEMRDTSGQQWIVSEAEAGKPSNKAFSVRLSGENFGPIEGFHTTKLIASSISDQLQMYSSMSDAMSGAYFNPSGLTSAILTTTGAGLVKLAQWGKLATVVMDVFNGLQNAIGSPIALMGQGFGAYKHAGTGLKVGWQAIADVIYTSEGQFSEDFEDAIRYGLLDSARAQEIRNTPFEYVKRLISDEKRSMGLMHVLSTAKGATVETYAMADAWIKIPAFKYRTKVLADYYAAKGENPGMAAIKKEAADAVKDTTIGFSRTPGIVRAAERVGATTFLPYFLATFKTQYSSLAVAGKDFVRANNETNPKAAAILYKHALDRAAGTMAMLGILTVGIKAIAGALSGGEDDDKLEEQKKLLFKDARYSDQLPLGKDANGNPVFFRISRLDPFGPMNDMFRIAMNTHMSAEEKNKAITQSFYDLFFANRGVVSVAKLALGAVHGVDIDSKNSKMERIAPATTARVQAIVRAMPGLDYNDGRAVTEFMDSLVPGVMDAFDPKNKGPAKPKGEWQAELGALVTGIGGRLDVADPGQALYGASKDLATARTEGRAMIAQARNDKLSKQEVVSRFLDSAKVEYEAMQAVAEKYDAMVKGLGYTPRQAMEVLKDNNYKGGLTAADMALISQGRMPTESGQWIKEYSRMLSEDSLSKRDDRTLNDSQKAQSKSDRKAFLDEMKAMGFKTQEH
jgi:hypothetical protein